MVVSRKMKISWLVCLCSKRIFLTRRLPNCCVGTYCVNIVLFVCGRMIFWNYFQWKKNVCKVGTWYYEEHNILTLLLFLLLIVCVWKCVYVQFTKFLLGMMGSNFHLFFLKACFCRTTPLLLLLLLNISSPTNWLTDWTKSIRAHRVYTQFSDSLLALHDRESEECSWSE